MKKFIFYLMRNEKIYRLKIRFTWYGSNQAEAMSTFNRRWGSQQFPSIQTGKSRKESRNAGQHKKSLPFCEKMSGKYGENSPCVSGAAEVKIPCSENPIFESGSRISFCSENARNISWLLIDLRHPIL